jgi:hypothetical protein
VCSRAHRKPLRVTVELRGGVYGRGSVVSNTASQYAGTISAAFAIRYISRAVRKPRPASAQAQGIGNGSARVAPGAAVGDERSRRALNRLML